MKIPVTTSFVILLAFWPPQWAAEAAAAQRDDKKVVMCYFGSWSTYRWSYGQFDVEDIDPFLCSHLVFGFAGLHQSNLTIRSLDPFNDLYDNWGKGAFQRFTGLKNVNPQLKTLLAIGGWNEGATTYSQMASTKQSRARFIQSALEMVLEHGFDGFDLDWEYPGGRDDSPGDVKDKENFVHLIREMRPLFDEHGLLLTAAVSAGKDTIDKAYDVPAMAEYLDYINLMTYDYHGWWGEHAYTGHNSPLFARPDELDEDSPGFQANVDFTVNYWMSLGAPANKLLMGIGAYGRGFYLADPSDNGLYAPASSGIDPGYYTGSRGFWGYNEYCEKMLTQGPQWTMIRENNVVAPYAYNGHQWLSYDDEESVRIKSEYILQRDLAGAMVWSIDTDDFQGFCTGKKFGIIATIAETLWDGQMPSTASTTSSPPPTSLASSSTTTTSQNGDHPICDTPGLKADPMDCQKFYSCQPNGQGGWRADRLSCGQSLLFDKEQLLCNWPEAVHCSNSIRFEKKMVVSNAFHCPGEGFFPDGPCSTTFYECVRAGTGYIAYEFHCPPGTVFDSNLDLCNYPYLVEECGATSSTSSTSVSPLPPSDICSRIGLNENPYEDCSSIYYDCQLTSDGLQWRITQLRCDNDLYFDPPTLACTSPANIDGCRWISTTSTSTTIKTTESTTTTTSTTSTTEEPNSICQHPGLNPDPNFPRDCNIYYACKPAPNYPDHWIITECHCDNGLAFDPLLEVCTWPSSLEDCPSRGLFNFYQDLSSGSPDECIARRYL